MPRRLERFSGSTVLVVDDTVANLELLDIVLADEGITHIVTESDPRRVESLLPEIRPDLVLLDLLMPHLDGHAVLEQITRYAAGTYLPVLVLTADVSPDARNRALAHGARDFLTKPFDITETVLRIANLLETRGLYAALRPPNFEADAADAGDAADAVRAVLSDGNILPVYQPVIDIDTMQLVGYEALSRFPEPHVRGPSGWFTDAFDAGVGVELEWLAIAKALPALDTLNTSAFVALNMSPASALHLNDHQLCDPALYPQIVIELTEHVPIEDYGAIHRALADMRSRGARLAVDDLGSGYAGFRHLLLLEPDIIKLDISLVHGVHQSRNARALTAALVAFAADIGAIVIAEGVEEPEELAAIRDLHVPWAQGYLLGRPSPLVPGVEPPTTPRDVRLIA